MKKLMLRFDAKTRHAGVSALITILVLASILAGNLVIGTLDVQADLTPKKLYSLTDETRSLLDRLDADVEILALYAPGEEPESIMEAVEEYERAAPSVTVRLVDPDREPALVARYADGEEPVRPGSFIVESKGNFRVIPAMDLYDLSYNQQGQPQVTGQKVEQRITAAIAYVTSGRIPRIYEIVGHRESPLADLGYGPILEQANFASGTISLVRDGVPEDASLLTLIGPRGDLSEAEARILNTWLEEGDGRLMVALDLTEQPLPNLYGLLAAWDIEVRHGLVLETRSSRLIAEFGDNPFVFAPYLSDHDTVAPLAEAQLDPIFQATLGFRRTSAEQRRLDYAPLLSSSEDSRLRTDLTSEQSGNPAPIPGDESGPIDIAVAVSERNPDTYEPDGAVVVALGSASTLGGLGFLGQIKANADLVMNLVNWAVADESVVNVPSKSLFRLPLRIDTVSAIVYFVLTVVVIPLAGLIAGLVIYLRRRNA